MYYVKTTVIKVCDGSFTDMKDASLRFDKIKLYHGWDISTD